MCEWARCECGGACRVAAGSGVGDARRAVRGALAALERQAQRFARAPAELLCSKIPLHLEMAALCGVAHSQAVVRLPLAHVVRSIRCDTPHACMLRGPSCAC